MVNNTSKKGLLKKPYLVRSRFLIMVVFNVTFFNVLKEKFYIFKDNYEFSSNNVQVQYNIRLMYCSYYERISYVLHIEGDTPRITNTYFNIHISVFFQGLYFIFCSSRLISEHITIHIYVCCRKNHLTQTLYVNPKMYVRCKFQPC